MKKRISLSNGIKLPYLFCAAVISGFFSNPARAQIQATGMLSARPDNVFVEPTSGGVFWDVLRNDDPGTCSPYGDLKVRISAPPTRRAVKLFC